MTPRILVIKFGAIGDVIRTTPLLRRVKAEYPYADIWWLTRSPEVLPDIVDQKLKFSLESTLILQETTFDILYNLDKDREACALAQKVTAKKKKGFILQDGKCAPIDQDAEHKFLTGLFDDVSRRNTKRYQQEIFEICGFTFKGEKYLLNLPPTKEFISFDRKGQNIIGLNTGCGGRWPSRLWPEPYWVTLAEKLLHEQYSVLLLGGEQEHEKNLRIAQQSGAEYLGYFDLLQFMALINRCDLIVTAVTMAMHFAIGCDKKIVLFNNIFNKNEFELYGLGEILEPAFNCICYYSPVCEKNCMQYLSVEAVFEACLRLLKPQTRQVNARVEETRR